MGGCLAGNPADLAVLGARVVARIAPEGRDFYTSPQPISITSLRGDGGGLRTLVSGTYRGPRGPPVGSGRVAWWQKHCAGGTELVSTDVPVGASRSCTLRVRTHAARRVGSRISVRVTCPLGCTGQVVDDTRCGSRFLRTYTLPKGTHRLRVTLPRRTVRRGRALLRFKVDAGPSRRAAIRLRR